MIGHSYVVALNRRLCREVARAAGGFGRGHRRRPEATSRGDLRPITLEPLEGEPYELVPLPMRLTQIPQLTHYGLGSHRGP